MRRILILCSCSIALLTISCGENKSADSREQAPLAAPRQQTVQAQPAAQKQATAAPQQTTDDTPIPPKDAQITILCTIIPGPGHIQRAKQVKDDLISSTKLKGWYVSHDEQQSTLYYGYYRSLEDPKLKADRARIATMQDNVGNRPFADALPVAINSPDPTAPLEYDLANAKGYWSLLIGTYQGPGRKEAAVDAVREARKSGVEAYYHHGKAASDVCVGSWPEEAIRKQEFDGGRGVDPMDRDRPILVLGSGAEIPPALKEQYAKQLVDKESGRHVQVLEQKVDILDPTMRGMMDKYPVYAVNGIDQYTPMRDPTTGKIVNIPTHTVPVPIPHNDSVLQNSQEPAPSLLAPSPSPAGGPGQLRSIGQ
jgi:hypothetical protein